jgi:hypothetical protein
MLGISPEFIQYLHDDAPSLLLSTELSMLSFRWKIPKTESLTGWTSKKGGIDMIRELHTKEFCGFVGLHFPVNHFLRSFVMLKNGPYSATELVASIQEFCERLGDDGFGIHLPLIEKRALEADANGCVLRYVSYETIRPELFCQKEFLSLFPAQIPN